VGEEDEAVGLGGAEIKRNGSHPLGVPFGEADVGLGCLKRNGVQSGHVLTLVGHLALDLHLGVQESSHSGQLEADVIVFIHHLRQVGGGLWLFFYAAKDKDVTTEENVTHFAVIYIFTMRR